MKGLTGKTALVTGGSRGIGRAIAARLAAEGVLVGVHYAGNDAAAQETVTAIRESGGDAFQVRAELSGSAGVDALFTGLVEGLGKQPLDILVNNAAVMSYAATAEAATPEDYDRLFAINVRAPFFVTQRALGLLRDGGRIINISSGSTWFVTPETVYAMTKGALNAFSRSLAQCLGARGITVNTISPGIIATGMNSWLDDDPETVRRASSLIALGRLGQAADVGDAVAFFASDEARWISGETVEVNGGLLLGPPKAGVGLR